MNPAKSDSWQEAAKKFYAARAPFKARPEISGVFLRAYQKLGARLPRTGGRLLDLGCGTGAVTSALEGPPGSVIGIDISLESLHFAREKAKRASFVNADMAALPFRNRCFDHAVAVTSLEFCSEKENVLAELKRTLKQGGYFYLEVRNAGFPGLQIPGFFHALLVSLKIIVPYQAQNFQDLSYRQWRELLEKSGWTILREYPSLWPWNFGNLMTRLKNLLILAVKTFFPLRSHYMTGFLCQKRNAEKEMPVR